MGKWIRKHKEPLLITTLIIFFVSTFVGVGSMVFMDSDSRELAAKVGKSRVEIKPFQATLRQTLEGMKARDPKLEVTSELENTLKQDILRELIIRELFNIEARRWGLKVSPQEVAQDIVLRPLFQKDGKFDPRTYYEFVIRNMGMLPKDFEKERAADILSYKFRGVLTGTFASSESELRWLWDAENPGKGQKDWEKARNDFAQRIYQEKNIAVLNQLLSQLSQQHPIKTYLQ